MFFRSQGDGAGPLGPPLGAPLFVDKPIAVKLCVLMTVKLYPGKIRPGHQNFIAGNVIRLPKNLKSP